MALRFIKMHAHGDDFVLVDARGARSPINAQVATRLGDRHRGIGFNQLGVISDCADAAAQLLFWNPDGSTLGACGSATRGAADLLMAETGAMEVRLRTERGILVCRRAEHGQIMVDMGPPLLHWRDVPLSREADTLRLPLAGGPSACSIGNPHCTFIVADIDAFDPRQAGPPIEGHPLFPEKTNVHFVQVLDRNRIRLRIWERGGGVPEGSGSCACGAVVATIRRGLTDHRVDVLCDGGTVIVEWDETAGVWLTGGVTPVFYGTIHNSLLV